MNLVEIAASFAKEKHKDQKRKYTGAPYFEHCREVVGILKEFYIRDEEMLCAAYLHDTVEDTNTTFEELEKIFGAKITQFVRELTDVSKKQDGNREIRKEIDRQHTAKAQTQVKIIKLADLISNSRTIVFHDANFAKVYMAEKKRLLEVLGTEQIKNHYAGKFLFEFAQQLVDDYFSRTPLKEIKIKKSEATK
jgi:(p)ppGpp synthase/HD superfamily hydrolase